MFICSENLVIKHFVSILVLSTVQETKMKKGEPEDKTVTGRIS